MTSLHFNILTLFPEMFPGSLGHSLSGRALEKRLWSYACTNIRDFGEGVHKAVDDTPYGGGAGMVMRADVLEKALLSVMSSRQKQRSCVAEGPGSTASKPDPSTSGLRPSAQDDKKHRLIYMSPRGEPLTQAMVKDLAACSSITLLCGRYEGVDQRFLDAHDFEEISIGDYVLSGGEPAALILMDACIRLLPGVMGNDDTPLEESFSNGLLEYPHYTRPAAWEASDGKSYDVPDILKSGDHKKIADWRHAQSVEITKKRRPDLL